MKNPSKSAVSSALSELKRFPTWGIVAAVLVLALAVGGALLPKSQPANATDLGTISDPYDPQDLDIDVDLALSMFGTCYPRYRVDPDNARPYYVDRAITFGPFEKIPEDVMFSVSTDEHPENICIGTKWLELGADFAAPDGESWENTHFFRVVNAGDTLLQLSAKRFDDGIYLVLETFRLAEDVGLRAVPVGEAPTSADDVAVAIYLNGLGEHHRRDYTHLTELKGDQIALSYHDGSLTIVQTATDANTSARSTISFGSGAPQGALFPFYWLFL